MSELPIIKLHTARKVNSNSKNLNVDDCSKFDNQLLGNKCVYLLILSVDNLSLYDIFKTRFTSCTIIDSTTVNQMLRHDYMRCPHVSRYTNTLVYVSGSKAVRICREEYLLVWHCAPENPDGQLQVKESTPSTQVPPF